VFSFVFIRVELMLYASKSLFAGNNNLQISE